jgi:hypothetical protein
MPRANTYSRNGEDRLARLTDTRDKLAAALAADPSPRDLPAISREYRMVLGELAELDAKKETPDVVDQLAARRQAAPACRATRSS